MVRRAIYTLLCLWLLSGSNANAEIVRFDFTGTVTNRFNNGLPNPSDIFGLTVNVGGVVSGSFTIDTAASLLGSVNGAVGGAIAGYTQTLPLDMKANLAGGLFTSNGDFTTSIANNFQNVANLPALEQFSVSDGVSEGFQNISGDTILLNGTPETARIAFTFTDSQLTAFSSIALPNSLDVSVFEAAQGTITGTRPSGNVNPFFYSVEFRINTLTTTVVPEPTSVTLLWACMGGMAFLRRRQLGSTKSIDTKQSRETHQVTAFG